MEYSFLGQVVWYAGIVVEAILVARLLQLRLAKRYPVLYVYLCFGVVRGTSLAYLLHSRQRLFDRNGYELVYIVTQPIQWGLYFLLILELYSLMLEDFPGIRRLGRLVMFAALASVTLACCALIVVDEQAGFDHYPFISYLILQRRSVFFCLSTLTLALLLFAAYYRLPIRRNLWIVYASFGGFFVANALLLTLRRYFGDVFRQSASLMGALFYFSALLGVVLFLSKAGETESRPISVVWGRRNTELEAALSSQLQSFNQLLLKTLRQ